MNWIEIVDDVNKKHLINLNNVADLQEHRNGITRVFFGNGRIIDAKFNYDEFAALLMMGKEKNNG